MGKTNSTEKKLLIILLGVIIFVACYFLGFQKLQAEADALEIENVALEGKVAELKIKIEKQEEYEKETAKMQEELRMFFNEFPVYVQVEDGIMDVIDLEVDADTFISSLTFGESVAVDVTTPTTENAATVAEDTADADSATEAPATDASTTETAETSTGGAASRYTLYETPMDIVYETTYDGAKELIQNIVSSGDKKSITGLVLTFDSSTGILSGTTTYANWFISGQDKTYDGANIPNVPTGTDNIFGTIDVDENQEAE
ncbi:MAG: hypothetical protein SOX33_04255 [Agathobacter sp.]|nr:hypothetical protein [Agathobacter sp.]